MASTNPEVVHGYEIPSWAGNVSLKGLHLDVHKDGKLLQKLMVDEKKYYFFGRNPTLNDFCIDHSSCSRVHAVIVFHKVLERFFLVDLGSTHGTFAAKKRLEANCPTQLLPGVEFSFGASTRIYTLRERPGGPQSDGGQAEQSSQQPLPEDEFELDHLTEYNTANNKRISTIGITDLPKVGPRKRKSVVFRDEEEVINPEDVDPSVGRFRNLIQTSVIIPSKGTSKRMKPNDGHFVHYSKPDHTIDVPSVPLNPLISNSLGMKLGIDLPNPAPDLDETPEEFVATDNSSSEKKKYAKELWPGKLTPGSGYC